MLEHYILDKHIPQKNAMVFRLSCYIDYMFYRVKDKDVFELIHYLSGDIIRDT